MTKRTHPTLVYLLKALVPYTSANLQLSFHPQRFFDELERTTRIARPTLEQAYRRAVKRQLINEHDSHIELSLHARQLVQPFIAKRLTNGGQLMIIFDIPEYLATTRRQLRYVLRQLKFKQVQQSVWMSDKDHIDIIRETIATLNADNYVQLYEAARIDSEI